MLIVISALCRSLDNFGSDSNKLYVAEEVDYDFVCVTAVLLYASVVSTTSHSDVPSSAFVQLSVSV